MKTKKEDLNVFAKEMEDLTKQIKRRKKMISLLDEIYEKISVARDYNGIGDNGFISLLEKDAELLAFSNGDLVKAYTFTYKKEAKYFLVFTSVMNEKQSIHEKSKKYPTFKQKRCREYYSEEDLIQAYDTFTVFFAGWDTIETVAKPQNY